MSSLSMRFFIFKIEFGVYGYVLLVLYYVVSNNNMILLGYVVYVKDVCVKVDY